MRKKWMKCILAAAMAMIGATAAAFPGFGGLPLKGRGDLGL